MTHTWWYIARSSGLVAWVLLVASLVIGALYSGRMTESRTRRALLDIHPWLSGLALGAVALHIVAIVGDSYVQISPAQALVPFASPWRPVAIAWGAIALWLMVFIEVTALARKYMARRTWHAIHLASYALAVLATIHGITAGTDTAAAPVRWAMAAIVLFATVVTVMRAAALRRGSPARGVRPAAASAPVARAPRPPAAMPVASFAPTERTHLSSR
jgi:DMSO/TMAO reductase YedYZ heme-binding membrane subunit